MFDSKKAKKIISKKRVHQSLVLGAAAATLIATGETKGSGGSGSTPLKEGESVFPTPPHKAAKLKSI